MRVFVFLLVGIVLAGCGSKREAAPYEVVDSGAWASDLYSVWWLDNERVLFGSNEKQNPAGGGPETMSIWEAATGRVSAYKKRAKVLCVRDGQVIYAERDFTGAVRYYRGRPGAEQPYPRPSRDAELNPQFDCTWGGQRESRAHLPYWIKLSGENRLQVFAHETLPEPPPSGYPGNLRPTMGRMKYFEQRDADGVPLPFVLGDYNNYSIQYVESRQAYLISPTLHWSDRPPPSVWWLERDGRVAEVRLPQKLPWPATGGFASFRSARATSLHIAGAPNPSGIRATRADI